MRKIYIIKCKEYIGIGVHSDPYRKYEKVQTFNPYPVELCEVYDMTVDLTDGQILYTFRHKKHKGIWYRMELDEAKRVIENLLSMKKDDLKNLKRRKMGKLKGTTDPKIIAHRQYIKDLKSNGDITITDDVLKAIMTSGWGMPKHKATKLGIPYPLRNGWRNMLIGKKIPISLCKSLLSDI